MPRWKILVEHLILLPFHYRLLRHMQRAFITATQAPVQPRNWWQTLKHAVAWQTSLRD